MKPLIGITTYLDYMERVKYNVLSVNNTNSVYMAGGVPAALPIIYDPDVIHGYLNSIHGLIFSGGEDIAPVLLGEEPIREVNHISYERDIFEIELFREARKMDMPILGICRGIQLINAAAGGRNYQDIYKQHKGANGHNPNGIDYSDYHHSVNIDKDSKLYEIFGETDIRVNSLHHQAVMDPADGFKVTARAKDGIIEGIEAKKNTFIVGVQWHPEHMTSKHPEFINLYRAFIQNAQKYAERR